METLTYDYVVVGAGMSGLGFANWIRAEHAARGRAVPSIAILEAASEPGGYCRTVVQGGFVWDYSGHFFHFRDPAIEAWLRARMDESQIRTVQKRSTIRFAGGDVDFPFQKNIHQLPQADFLTCLADLVESDAGAALTGRDVGPPPRSFKDMLYRRFGAGIANRFLVPYNEKLYACDLDALDTGAMGRFFPHASLLDIVRQMRPGTAADGGYNAMFTYPRGGAMAYVNALLVDLPSDAVSLDEAVTAIDTVAHVVTTRTRTLGYRHLVSSAPLPQLAAMTGIAHDAGAFTANQVLVFNLGFDRKGPRDVHWMYFPDRATSYYRVGFYDNIHEADRMSLYVEIGETSGTRTDPAAMLPRVLADLRRDGIVVDHELVAWHSVVLDPAYVHITQRSMAETSRLQGVLAEQGIHSVGRYGGWTYCSIEDNLLETQALAARLAAT